ncbi:MAG: RNA polymerase sigma factor [Lachnospiraceae bacterium]|nr:RNA polymerase sigma factor [Lachnospiraceae bacterium]
MDNGASSYRRFLEGDDAGLVEIIRDYKDGLILYLNGYASNIHVAEEMTEDVFVKLGIKRPKYDEKKASFKTWLYTIGRNVAIDYLRRNRRRHEVSTEELQDLASEENSLELSYIWEEQKIVLHKAIRKLKAEYQQVLWLSYFEEFSNKEIAAIMKKSVRGVESLLYRARLAVKSELEKEGFEYEEL